MTDQTTEPDEALVEAVATAIDDRLTAADVIVYRGLDDVARAAIAAVRAWDSEREPFASQAIERPGCAPVVTLVWPRGRAEAVWVSAELVESFVHRVEVRG